MGLSDFIPDAYRHPFFTAVVIATIAVGLLFAYWYFKDKDDEQETEETQTELLLQILEKVS